MWDAEGLHTPGGGGGINQVFEEIGTTLLVLKKKKLLHQYFPQLIRIKILMIIKNYADERIIKKHFFTSISVHHHLNFYL